MWQFERWTLLKIDPNIKGENERERERGKKKKKKTLNIKGQKCTLANKLVLKVEIWPCELLMSSKMVSLLLLVYQ